MVFSSIKKCGSFYGGEFLTFPTVETDFPGYLRLDLVIWNLYIQPRKLIIAN